MREVTRSVQALPASDCPHWHHCSAVRLSGTAVARTACLSPIKNHTGRSTFKLTSKLTSSAPLLNITCFTQTPASGRHLSGRRAAHLMPQSTFRL